MNYVSREFGEVELRDAAGRSLRLAETWTERPCVLVFLRQFGCILCRKQAAELRPRIPELRRAGGDLVLIGTGSPDAAKAFQDELGLGDVRVLSDEARRAFGLAGFHRSVFSLLRPRAVWNYLRAFWSGHRPARKEGDALQQGGALVVKSDGTILYRYLSEASGDHPDADRMLAALRSAAPG